MSLVFDHSTLGQRILFGSGKVLDHVSTAIGDLGAQRVLLIASRSVGDLADAIADRVSVIARIDHVVQHVPLEEAHAATALAREQRIEAVLTVGGGSATGLGKIVARETGLPIVAVPSTFSGSEATNVWGQTDGGRKTTGVDDRVLPKTVVYDAELFRTLPAGLAAASTLNAVAHAVDGLWAPRADPINTALGTEALRTLVPGLRTIAAGSEDLAAREEMLYGAYLAAVAFASAGSGMHHKICHVLGGAFALSHAEMHAIVLPYVVAFNAPVATAAAARVSAALDGAPAASGLRSLRRETGIPESLADLGLREQDIPEAARLATEAIPASNPRPFTLADVEGIIRAAWAGDDIEE